MTGGIAPMQMAGDACRTGKRSGAKRRLPVACYLAPR